MTTEPEKTDAEWEAECAARKEKRAARRALLDREVTEWTEEELLTVLAERYAEPVIPPCRICGSALSIQRIGGGLPIVYACDGREDDPDSTDGGRRMKAGRRPADQHYCDSQYEDTLQGGDSAVMELCRRFAERRAAAPLPVPPITAQPVDDLGPAGHPCDATCGLGSVTACTERAVYECGCERCEREQADERFHACSKHLDAAAVRHAAIRGRKAFWFYR